MTESHGFLTPFSVGWKHPKKCNAHDATDADSPSGRRQSRVGQPFGVATGKGSNVADRDRTTTRSTLDSTLTGVPMCQECLAVAPTAQEVPDDL